MSGDPFINGPHHSSPQQINNHCYRKIANTLTILKCMDRLKFNMEIQNCHFQLIWKLNINVPTFIFAHNIFCTLFLLSAMDAFFALIVAVDYRSLLFFSFAHSVIHWFKARHFASAWECCLLFFIFSWITFSAELSMFLHLLCSLYLLMPLAIRQQAAQKLQRRKNVNAYKSFFDEYEIFKWSK